TGELAFGAPPRKLFQRALVLRVLVPYPRAPENAEHSTRLEQHEVERNFWNVSGGKADDEMTPAPRERAQRRFAIAPAHGIEHHVNAVCPHKPAQALTQILFLVIEDLMRAVRARKCKFLVA